MSDFIDNVVSRDTQQDLDRLQTHFEVIGRRFDEANQRRAEMRRAITRLREADRAASGSHWGFGDTLSNERYAAEMEVERLIGGMR